MHLRRAILLFALVLGLTALAAAVSPIRQDSSPPPAPAAAAPSPVAPSSGVARAVTFRSRATGAPSVRRARVGEHIVVTVYSADGGLATIPQLGRTASVSPGTPARFDLLAPAAGRYDVMLAIGAGTTEPRRVGSLLTEP